MSNSVAIPRSNTSGLMDRVLADLPTNHIPTYPPSQKHSKRKCPRSGSGILQTRGKYVILGKQVKSVIVASTKKRLESSGRTIYNTARTTQAEEGSRGRGFGQMALACQGLENVRYLTRTNVVHAAEAGAAGKGGRSIGANNETGYLAAGLAFGEPSLSGLIREGSWTAMVNDLFEELIDVDQCL